MFGQKTRQQIKIADLITLAIQLKSEHGENTEYDRALVELVTDAAGLSMEYKKQIAGLIGVATVA